MSNNPTDNQTPQPVDIVKNYKEKAHDAMLKHYSPSQPVDELDEILENWYAQSKEQLKARLLQWGTGQRIDELNKIENAIVELKYEEYWDDCVDSRRAELQASLKDGGTK